MGTQAVAGYGRRRVSLGGVLLDAAGTLIELAEPVGDTYSRAARRQGVELPGWRLDDAFRRVLARSEPMVFPEAADDEIASLEREWWRARVRSTFLAADSTVQFDDPVALFDELFDHYRSPGAWRLCADAAAGLASLRDLGLALGVASNFDHRLAEILEDLEIDGFFESITTPGSCRRAKPDPLFFEAACRALGAPPGDTLHVGDDPRRDAEAARRAGLHALCLSEVEGGWAGLPARVAALATLGRPSRGTGPDPRDRPSDRGDR